MARPNLKDRILAAREESDARRDEKSNHEDCNYLVVSDNHLGEFIKDHARIEYLKRTADLDRDFCNFLEYFGNHRRGGKPWRLVINGDMLDFLTVTVKPSERAQGEVSGLNLSA
ncbi:MAG: hypothetical protein KC561_16565, partial [Myxococcales bacterium]|nr:hypothetical protein [Myxococcales bacterium]